MMTPAQKMGIPAPVYELWGTVETDLVSSIAKQLSRTDVDGPSYTAVWQIEKLRQMSIENSQIQSILKSALPESDKLIADAITRASEYSLKMDGRIYRTAGLSPTTLSASQALKEILQAGIINTNGEMRNFSRTAGRAAGDLFSSSVDRAYMQVISGGFTREQALRQLTNDLGKKGIDQVTYSGRKMELEAAARMCVSTGLNRTSAEMQLKRMDEMGTNLVEISAHAGARPTHAEWQGQIFAVGGGHDKYDNFEDATDYGAVDGLCGANCYHTFWPYIEGYSTRSFSYFDQNRRYGPRQLTNNEMYKESQKQRELERNIRAAKRDVVTQYTAMQNAQNEIYENMKKEDFNAAAANLAVRKKKLEDFIERTGRTRLNEREAVAGYDRKKSAAARWAQNYALPALKMAQ